MLGQRHRWWASIGPALGQRRVAGSVDKCFPPKRNKFRLIHRLYCPQEQFLTLITKAIDITSISYQPL